MDVIKVVMPFLLVPGGRQPARHRWGNVAAQQECVRVLDQSRVEDQHALLLHLVLAAIASLQEPEGAPPNRLCVTS